MRGIFVSKMLTISLLIEFEKIVSQQHQSKITNFAYITLLHIFNWVVIYYFYATLTGGVDNKCFRVGKR